MAVEHWPHDGGVRTGGSRAGGGLDQQCGGACCLAGPCSCTVLRISSRISCCCWRAENSARDCVRKRSAAVRRPSASVLKRSISSRPWLTRFRASSADRRASSRAVRESRPISGRFRRRHGRPPRTRARPRRCGDLPRRWSAPLRRRPAASRRRSAARPAPRAVPRPWSAAIGALAGGFRRSRPVCGLRLPRAPASAGLPSFRRYGAPLPAPCHWLRRVGGGAPGGALLSPSAPRGRAGLCGGQAACAEIYGLARPRRARMLDPLQPERESPCLFSAMKACGRPGLRVRGPGGLRVLKSGPAPTGATAGSAGRPMEQRVFQQPHSAPVSAGTPTLGGGDTCGRPSVQRCGPGSGDLGGTPEAQPRGSRSSRNEGGAGRRSGAFAPTLTADAGMQGAVVPRPAGRPRAGQAARLASISPCSTSASAICTAFSAAPLRRLSETHQKARPCGTVGSRRRRET